MELPEPPWRSPARRTVKQPLSRERVVRTALDLLDREGLDAVSMRRVAQALDTGAASLYAYVSGKDELRELMFDAVLGEVDLPEPDPARWADQVRDLLRGQLRVMLAHPGIAQVAWATMVPVGPNALRHGEALIALLRAGGLDEKRAAFAFDTLALYTKAFAYEGTVWASGEMSQEEAAARGRQTEEYMRSLPPEVFPNMLAVGRYFSGQTAAERFEFTLDVFLSGLAHSS
ncbi:TetR/AcrR family transcriptional regulator [Amycolatopsis suaedae]|uniref:TetR/AcrR family transcriptional regulator n=1 Tax=Amycolatopsis suaedae TaxID=2510978 RepID=A0A4Q7J1C0_9PSEU|nr:TetR/AcrR family transcriptional regulator [Amycolatopsis suaedae]RZQ60382.1 TetR/AcrR family transcriptional regulator [Amycolatopsis suaedae]